VDHEDVAFGAEPAEMPERPLAETRIGSVH